MCSTRRISLNTSLKDARIFDEESNDNEETKSEQLEKVDVKTEPVDAKEVKFDLQLGIKEEEEKEEADDGGSISSAVAQMQLKTPVKIENSDDIDENRTNLKSAKRSLLKQRNSPYAKEVHTGYATRSITQRNKTLYEEFQESTRDLASKRREEKDPEVLRRRQKQIDFGKNTTGYDNYVKLVPKKERTRQDPQTPNKRGIYSRRGFDGLIKQWRLQLHKYDP